ncbi:DUF2089 family protein [Alloscardovia venturai]|uniref:DUF2089 family protein n=1 Tax=Alloscardovia venturai TaxID=1769421 RepID=A0ABW2Y6H8_9BIFI
MGTSHDWMVHLAEDDKTFIKNFMLSSGSLKKMSELYKISYPTLRTRLNLLIEKIHLYDTAFDDSYIVLIKSLAAENRLDAQTMELLIEAYNDSKPPNELPR